MAAARCVFFLAAGVYLGGMVGLGAVAAPQIFRTLRETGAAGITAPYLGKWNQLGGEVFGNVLAGFRGVEIGCTVAMVLAVLLEAALCGSKFLGRGWHWARIVILAAVAGLLLYDVRLTEQVWDVRGQWRNAIGSAREPGIRDEFDRLHVQAEAVAHWKVYVLAAMVCVTAVGTALGGREKSEEKREKVGDAQ